MTETKGVIICIIIQQACIADHIDEVIDEYVK